MSKIEQAATEHTLRVSLTNTSSARHLLPLILVPILLSHTLCPKPGSGDSPRSHSTVGFRHSDTLWSVAPSYSRC